MWYRDALLFYLNKLKPMLGQLFELFAVVYYEGIVPSFGSRRNFVFLNKLKPMLGSCLNHLLYIAYYEGIVP